MEGLMEISDVIELLDELGEEAESDGMDMMTVRIREAIDCLKAREKLVASIGPQQETREKFLEYLVTQVVDALPTNRDWLDPELENLLRREAK